MPKPFLPTLLRLIATLVVMVGVLAFGSHAVSIGEHPGTALLEAGLHGADGDGDHGHTHDDGEPQAGHAHGHNPVDHTHNLLATEWGTGQPMEPAVLSWRPPGSDPAVRHGLCPPDRPPRRTITA